MIICFVPNIFQADKEVIGKKTTISVIIAFIY